MYQVMDGCNLGSEGTVLLRDVFLFGEEGIPLQGRRVVNRFANFKDDQLLIWLMHHQNRELVHLPGVVLPLFGDWSFNFWHWCSEALPMALLAHDGGFRGTYLVPATPFAAESLQLLGVPGERIAVAGENDYHLECMCLFAKYRGNDPVGTPARMRVADRLKAGFVADRARHRLYISRNGHPDNMRKVVNEEQLLPLLERYGFAMLRLEELSLAEQLRYSCNAEALVGPHGAGMIHCAFMPEGSLVVEMFPPTYINPCILLPCRARGHRYIQMTSPCLYSGYPHGYDVAVDLLMLEMTLDQQLSAF